MSQQTQAIPIFFPATDVNVCNTCLLSVQEPIETTQQTYRLFPYSVIWDATRVYCEWFYGERLAILDTEQKQNNLVSQL